VGVPLAHAVNTRCDDRCQGRPPVPTARREEEGPTEPRMCLHVLKRTEWVRQGIRVTSCPPPGIDIDVEGRRSPEVGRVRVRPVSSLGQASDPSARHLAKVGSGQTTNCHADGSASSASMSHDHDRIKA
jgi:hypothetical protein